MSSRSSSGMPAWLERIAAPMMRSEATTAPPKISATYGLRRAGCTFAKIAGTTFSRAMPNRIRDWATTVTSAVLLMATMAMRPKITSITAAGMKKRSARTTSRSVLPASASIGTARAAAIETST